jgi:hypothetical protein
MRAVIQAGELLAETLVGDEVVTGPLYLPVTVDDAANQSWSWIARFQGMRLGEYGEEVSLPSLRFQVPAGDDALDLSSVFPVSQSGGTITLRGPAGRDVVSIVDPDGDGVATVTYSDGETAPLPLPPGPAGPDGRDEEGRLHSTPLGEAIWGGDPGDAVATGTDLHTIIQGMQELSVLLMDATASTGLRNLTGMVSDATGGQVLISRRGPVVELALVNLLMSGAAAWGTLLTLPAGFRPALPAAEAALIPQGSSSGVISVRRSDGRVDINRLGPTVRHKLTFVYMTGDPWPTVLPGTPA